METLPDYENIAKRADVKVHINYLHINILRPEYLGTPAEPESVPSGFFWIATATSTRKFSISKQVYVTEEDAWKAACVDNNLL